MRFRKVADGEYRVEGVAEAIAWRVKREEARTYGRGLATTITRVTWRVYVDGRPKRSGDTRKQAVTETLALLAEAEAIRQRIRQAKDQQ